MKKIERSGGRKRGGKTSVKGEKLRIEQQLDEYFKYCETVRGMSPATLVMKRNVLMRFVRVTEVGTMEEVTDAKFGQWMEFCRKSRAKARTINSYNMVILTAVRYFVGCGVAVPLHLSRIKRLKEGATRRRFYQREEIAAVVETCDEVLDDARTGLMIEIMFETGMRIAEITRLRRSEIDGQQICFVGKGTKAREVYVTVATSGRIVEYIEETGVEDYLWVDPKVGNGQPPSTMTVRKWLSRAFRAAGICDFYPHALRHSFATDLQRRGASVAEIKEMMGHASIATTERYLHGFEGKLRELFEKYQ